MPKSDNVRKKTIINQKSAKKKLKKFGLESNIIPYNHLKWSPETLVT